MSIKVVVGIDKVVIGLPFPSMPKGDELVKLSEEEKAVIHEKRKQYIAHGMHVVNMVKLGNHFVQKTEESGLKRYCVKSEQTDNLLFTVCFGRIWKTWTLSFEWNPSKLSPEEKDEFLANMSVMFDGHYEELYERGVVSHIEFCVDVYGADISNHVLIENGRKTKTIHKGTTYEGQRGSPLVLTMYDKAKQLGLSDLWLRIEARMKNRGMMFRQLVETPDAIKSPFGNVLVVDVNQLQVMAMQMGQPQLAGQLKELGLYGAVKNKPARQKVVSRLQEIVVDWWKPEEIWQEHLALLKGFHPTKYNSVW